jgi:hypothetical protein
LHLELPQIPIQSFPICFSSFSCVIMFHHYNLPTYCLLQYSGDTSFHY